MAPSLILYKNLNYAKHFSQLFILLALGFPHYSLFPLFNLIFFSFEKEIQTRVLVFSLFVSVAKLHSLSSLPFRIWTCALHFVQWSCFSELCSVMDERWIWLFYSSDAWFKNFKALEVMEFNFSLCRYQMVIDAVN